MSISKGPSNDLPRQLVDKLRDTVGNPYALIWIASGVGAGLWAAKRHRDLKDASSILLATAGSDVAVLAIILAAVALMGSFLQGRYGRVIKTAVRLDNFYFPFKVVTVVSAVAALVCFAGAIATESGTGTHSERAAMFGLGIGLTAWTVIGTVWLTFTFIWYSVDEQKQKDEEEGPAGH